MTRFPQFGRKVRRGFTLIELMVSMAVMALLLVLISQLFNSATVITTSGNKHMDADSQARLAFDRMAIDFARMVKRSDVDYYFAKNSGDNDQMAFYSESSGYYPSDVKEKEKGSVTLAGYRIRNAKLERLGKALVWNGVAAADKPMAFLPQKLTNVWPKIAAQGSDTDYQIIADQVFRMEVSFLIRDPLSANPRVPYLSDRPYPASAVIVPPATQPELDGLQNVVAIVVTIAVLDTKSQAIVDAAKLDAAAGNLPDSNFGSSADATSSETPEKRWKNAIESGGLGLPKPAAAQVRIYQRYFYLNPV